MIKRKVKIFIVGVTTLLVLPIVLPYGYVSCKFTAKAPDVSSVFAFSINADEKKSLQKLAELYSERQGVSYEQLKDEVLRLADKNNSTTVARRGDLDSGWFCRRGDSCAVALDYGYLYIKFIDVNTYSSLEISDEDRID